MKYFFPDSQDFVDPSFDFIAEERSPTRVRQRDDQYAHEVFPRPPYDGVLVSKAIVDGTSGTGRYTMAQQKRFYREGVRRFFRLDESERTRHLKTMGDCGAFTYVREPEPPYTVEEVHDFYETCGFDYGFSVDHVITAYRAKYDEAHFEGMESPPVDWARRQEITLELAADFLALCSKQRSRFKPIGVAQGWSPKSYAVAFAALQKMGYTRIALGGLVPLKTHEILAALRAAADVRRLGTEIHLLGVTRCENVKEFARLGVTSFDSTAPLTRAFKDAHKNYFTESDTYTAVRVPPLEGNASARKRIQAGQLDQDNARRLETACLQALREYGARRLTLDETLEHVYAYAGLFEAGRVRTGAYEQTLSDRPWESCGCSVCDALGIEVVLFRGAERNRRRGFHNLHVFYNRLQFLKGAPEDEANPRSRANVV